jgi:hypothetical protein
VNPAKRIASHLAALCIGAAIAGSVAALSNNTTESDVILKKPSPSSTAADGETRRAPKPGKESPPTLKANEFRQAWDAVPSRKLSRDDRKRLQSQILAKWAQVDLEGALRAALEEAWDDNDPFSIGILFGAFSAEFAARPLEAWALIQSGKLGVGSHIFRQQWLAAVAQKNGLLVASMLNEMPASLQCQAIEYALGNTKPGPDRDAILAKIIDQAAGQHDDWIQEAFKILPPGGDPAALRDRWSSLPAGSNRQVAMMQWGASLRLMDAEKLSAELSNVRPEFKNEAMKAMISQFNWQSPGLLAGLEFAVSSDQWGSVAKSTAPLLANFGETDRVDPAKLAEWGTTLPERPDTVETYHKAIGRYIRDDLPRAKTWFEAMPEGSWHREHGLAEFSQQALWRKNDPAASQWALDSISNPAVKAEAKKWRQDWQEQTNGGTR